jgi:hypothetical protein
LGRSIDLADLNGKRPRRAKVFAMPLKERSSCLHTMVYMHRNYLAGPFFSAGNQQCRGVRATAECHGQRQLG